MKANEAAVRSVMAAYDGSAAAAVKLQSATMNYYNAQMQLIAQIQDARTSIGDLFGNTIRNFKLAGLDNQGKYNFYQQEAASLQAQALTSSDPARRSGRLADEDQRRHGGRVQPALAGAAGGRRRPGVHRAGQATASALDARLEKMQKDTADATKKTLEDIKIVQDAANKQLEAAKT
jgi:hypothetical protein